MHSRRSLDSGATDDAHLHGLLEQKLLEVAQNTARNACVALGALCHASVLPPQPPVDTAQSLVLVVQNKSSSPSTAAGTSIVICIYCWWWYTTCGQSWTAIQLLDDQGNKCPERVQKVVGVAEIVRVPSCAVVQSNVFAFQLYMR